MACCGSNAGSMFPVSAAAIEPLGSYPGIHPSWFDGALDVNEFLIPEDIDRRVESDGRVRLTLKQPNILDQRTLRVDSKVSEVDRQYLWGKWPVLLESIAIVIPPAPPPISKKLRETTDNSAVGPK